MLTYFWGTLWWLPLQPVIRSGVQFSAVIPTTVGTDCSRQWDQGKLRQRPSTVSDSWEGANDNAFLECRAKFNLDANFWCRDVFRFWQSQPPKHLGKGIITWKAWIKYELLVLYICSLPLISLCFSTQSTLHPDHQLQYHIIIEKLSEHLGWIRNTSENPCSILGFVCIALDTIHNNIHLFRKQLV